MNFSHAYTWSDKTLCLDHVTDRYLKRQLTDEVTARSCSFCGREAPKREPPTAIPLDALGYRVYETAQWLFDDATTASFFEGQMYEDELETIEVVGECVVEGVDETVCDAVVEAIASAIESPETWIRSRLDDDFSYGWEDFAQTVQHESRFVFAGQIHGRGRENEAPERLSRFIAGLLTYAERETKMIVSLRAGTELFRGRMARDAHALLAQMEDGVAHALGPAPVELASAGRMNPQGVPFFYAGDSVRTAVAEIALHNPYDQSVVGRFVSQRELVVLDLTRQPVVPSIFDPTARRRFMFTTFFEEFVEAITAPVYLDQSHPVAYAPSQVVTEALRWLSPRPIDGIVFPSRAAKGGKNYCLFFGPGDDFRSDPPSSDDLGAEKMRRMLFSSSDPAFVLAREDVTLHEVARNVRVKSI